MLLAERKQHDVSDRGLDPGLGKFESVLSSDVCVCFDDLEPPEPSQLL